MKAFVVVLTLVLSGCAASTALPEYSLAPDFDLTDRSNRQVTRQDLEGKVWIADFIFTRCTGICPAMSANMAKLQNKLPKEVRLVSFSVDPDHDTPAVLSEYADRYNADSERWFFLTGSAGAIEQLSVGGFKLALDPTAGSEAEPITHSSRFVLVDQQGHIRGYYGNEDPEALDRLISDARNLL